MPSARTRSNDDRLVSRTYRAAIRIGEDFITLEETITLPIDASDDEVQQAVDLGWRIYQAQREAAEAQIADVRESAGAPTPIVVRDPDAPASEKQRNYIATLQDSLGWDSDRLVSYASDQGVDLVTLNKGQASVFIDGLKKLIEQRSGYGDAARAGQQAPRAAEVGRNGDAGRVQPVNEKQIHALERLGRQHGFDINAEAQRRFGSGVSDLSFDQASALLRELQRPGGSRRSVEEPAL